MLEAKKLLKDFNLQPNKKIIAAISGGIDSMALLAFFLEEKIRPIVVHFNHNTRDTNKLDESLVKTFCKNYNLTLHVVNINITKGNFQSQAREQRYYHLEKIAKKYHTNYIATAHHLDDLAETVLIKLTRGSNLYGYSGIHPIFTKNNYTYIKPLLHTSKESIVKYQQFNEIPYNDDESNFTDSYLRNRYRHAVLPIMKQENKQFLNKVLTYHKQLSSSYNYINKEASKYIVNDLVDLTTFKELDMTLQDEIISILLTRYELEVSFETISKIRMMLLNDSTNNSYDLKNNIKLIKSYNVISVEIINKPLNFVEVLNSNQTTIANVGKITFLEYSCADQINCRKLWYNEVSLPLIARSRKPGDKLSFSFGRKKLKDYLIDKKIPPHKRDQLWLITDSNDVILWVSDVYVNETISDAKEKYFIIGDLENNGKHN